VERFLRAGKSKCSQPDLAGGPAERGCDDSDAVAVDAKDLIRRRRPDLAARASDCNCQCSNGQWLERILVARNAYQPLSEVDDPRHTSFWVTCDSDRIPVIALHFLQYLATSTDS
jgi:hypothetical protein